MDWLLTTISQIISLAVLEAQVLLMLEVGPILILEMEVSFLRTQVKLKIRKITSLVREIIELVVQVKLMKKLKVERINGLQAS